MKTKVRFFAAMVIAVVALALSGCGGKDAEESTETAAAADDGVEVTAVSAESSADEGETMKIEDADDLVAFAERVNGGEATLDAILENDIDLSSVCSSSLGSFMPIEENYWGEFDGNGHTIQNLYCVYPDNENDSAALFVGELRGIVKDLRLENVVVEAEDRSAGIALVLMGSGRIENCSVDGTITGSSDAAGIVNFLYEEGSVYNCVNEAEVTGKYCAAGIVGVTNENAFGKISGCINRGHISEGNTEAVNGIVAFNYGSNVQIENCVDEMEPTLENSKAKLLYAKDNYAVAAYYGPDGGTHVNAHFCDSEGNWVGGFCGRGTLDNGWQLVGSTEFPKGYDYSGIGVIIWDTNAERGEDGEYPSKTHLNIEQMSTEEMKEAGLDFLDGHCCLVDGGGYTMVSNTSFGLTYGITWYDDYYFTAFSDIDGFADRFSYFAGDGTPLDEYFEGYSTLEITVLDSMFDVMLLDDSGEYNKEKQRAMCDELRACKPYVIYTGLDGTEQKFDLLTD